ncbi:MAG: hypothetical protein ONA90_04555 [candidate division KSB1 bacterium]|nr:hypothetical protein [candidate division KSB1 bacterium]
MNTMARISKPMTILGVDSLFSTVRLEGCESAMLTTRVTAGK